MRLLGIWLIVTWLISTAIWRYVLTLPSGQNKRHGRKISKNGQGEQKLWLNKSEQISRRSHSLELLWINLNFCDGQTPSNKTSDVITAGDIKITELQKATPCNLVKTYTRFGGKYCLHTQQLVRPTASHLYQTLCHHLPQGSNIRYFLLRLYLWRFCKYIWFWRPYHVHSENKISGNIY